MTELTPYQRKLQDRLVAMPLVEAPEPWARAAVHSVGALRSIGYGAGSDLLLVASTSGLGVFDCITGDRIARDDDLELWDWRDEVHLTAPGIGPLQGESVSMAGLHGGGLRLATEDGWGLQLVWVHLASCLLFLEQPGPRVCVFVEEMSEGCIKVFAGEGVRACGFSPTGRRFVVAEGSHTLYIFSRADARRR